MPRINVPHRGGTPTFNITLRLNAASMTMLDAGVSIMAQITGKAGSRAAWIRGLIDFALGSTNLDQSITKNSIDELWPAIHQDDSNLQRTTVMLEQHHRILLRQFECYAQSLDWTLDLERNEAALLLIAEHGKHFNRALEAQLIREQKKTPT